MDNLNQQFIVALIGFFLGGISGYLAHDFIKRSLGVTEDVSKNVLLYVVTFAWGMGMLVSLLNPAYSVPVPVHALMGAIVGFFFYNPLKK